jgi:purine-binding chemotaxis protein CheW
MQAMNRWRRARKSGGDAGGDVFGAVGKTLFGVPITPHSGDCGAARPQPVPLAPELCGRPGSLPRRRADHGEPAPVAGHARPEGPQDILVLESCGRLLRPAGRFGGRSADRLSADHEPNPSILDERRRALFAGAYKLKDSLLVMLDPERLDPMRLARLHPGIAAGVTCNDSNNRRGGKCEH